jgi:hypothetical protein
MKEERITATEIMLQMSETKYYAELQRNLAIVLDFVERWNKQDAERDVANAAQFLERLVSSNEADK